MPLVKGRPKPSLAYDLCFILGGVGLWVIALPLYPLWLRIGFIIPLVLATGFWIMAVLWRFLGWEDSIPRGKNYIDGITDGIGLVALLITIGHFYLGLPVDAPPL